MGNPEYEIRTHQSSEGDAYMYDNLYRITRTIYDDADPTNPTYASARTDDWLLDDIGNRTKIYAKSATPTEYEHNAVNEYTSVGGTGYEYDAAGNLTKDDTHYYYWDYENRLTKVELVSDSSDVAAYTYDANNRRVEKIVYTADPDETTQYFYDSWSCIEEREDDGTLLATYINGPRIDEYILMNRDSTDCWYMQSPIVGNVAALVNSSGTIQEGYKYRAYGKATVLTGAGNDSTWFTSDDDTATTSAIGNPYTFTGRRLDPETMLMHFRMRMYQTDDGSFISRDPAGYADGMSLYLGYFAPLATDPLGLTEETGGKCPCRIFLTFDDGLHNARGTPEVLDALKAEKVHATFFINGEHFDPQIAGAGHASKNRDLLRRAVDEGHYLANHSFSHDYGLYADPSQMLDDFDRNVDYVKGILGESYDHGLEEHARLPGHNTWRVGEIQQDDVLGPGGANAGEVAANLVAKGYKVFGWDAEWKKEETPQQIAAQIEKQCIGGTDPNTKPRPTKKDGKLILLAHDKHFKDDSARLSQMIQVLKTSKKIKPTF